MNTLQSGHDVLVEGGEGAATVGAVRLRRARAELAVDEAWLRWIARFAGVTLPELATRFEVSPQAARRRTRRLREAKLVGLDGVVFQLTPLAVRLLGLGGRRRIHRRIAVQHRDHEAAIVRFVTLFELRQLYGDSAGEGWKVWTERDMRRRERDGLGRYSVETVVGGRVCQRWPDVGMEHHDGMKRAVEFEFTPKYRLRVRAIVRGYDASEYEHVRWSVRDSRIAKLLVEEVERGGRPGHQNVGPWSGLSPERAEEIRRRVPETRAS